MFLAIAAGDLIGSIVTDAMGPVILLLLFGLSKKAKKYEPNNKGDAL